MSGATDESLPDYVQVWNFHNAADVLLHSRLQSLMTTQSFLVGAFAAVFATMMWRSGRGDELTLIAFGLSVSVLALVMAHYFRQSLRSIKAGLNFLKGHLIAEPSRSPAAARVYRDYLVAIGEWQRKPDGALVQGSAGWQSLSNTVPSMLMVFWVACVIILLTRFAQVAGSP